MRDGEILNQKGKKPTKLVVNEDKKEVKYDENSKDPFVISKHFRQVTEKVGTP